MGKRELEQNMGMRKNNLISKIILVKSFWYVNPPGNNIAKVAVII